MALCQDNRLTYLNEAGYNVIRLPRKGILPLGVIGRDGKTNIWLGTLQQIWRSALPAPEPSKPERVTVLAGTRTNNIRQTLGLDILANLLDGMFGTTPPSLRAAYKNAKLIQFAFRDVRTVRIDPFEIGEFLAAGTLASHNVVARRFFFEGKNTNAFVISEVLQAKSIGVAAKKDANTDANVDVPSLQATLGVNISVAANGSSNSDVTYEGKEYLTFGYKCFGIGLRNRRWTVVGTEPSADYALSFNDDMQPFVERAELVDLSFNVVA